MKPITVRGRPLAGGALPAICVPLVARSTQALVAEAQAAAARGPDLLEWRVDFFDGIGDTARVLDAARRVRAVTAGVPILFTLRSEREGGQRTGLAEPQAVALYESLCGEGLVDLADWEMAAEPGALRAVRDATRAAGIGLLLSFHDFGGTPPVEQLLARFGQAQELGGDAGKVAVMPRSPADVLALLQATLQASEELAIPVAAMSMGALGAVSRVAGGAFGSALTFAVGQAASAPGQLPLGDLRAALAALRRAAG